MHDLIVVGAGLAGLLATWRLRDSGRDVLLLEASERVGGRIDRAGTPPMEVGPSWVWDNEDHVHALLRELGVDTFPHHQEGHDLYDDGQRVQRVRLPRGWVPERRVVGGTHALIDALAERIGPVTFEAPVRRIAAEDDGLHVTSAVGEHVASSVLVAVPPMLAVHEIQLPDLEEADRRWLAGVPIWMADVAKVVVCYPNRFWLDAGLSGRVYARSGPLVEIHDLSGPDGDPAALFGFLPQPLYTDDWRDRVIAQLTGLFGVEAGRPEAVECVAWWTRPWTAPSRRGPADPNRIGHPRLRSPRLQGRLHFVSTETSGVSPGHMNGAVERVEAVAQTLIG